MVFTPGSWGNIRSKANWFIVYDKKAKKSKTLFLPPRQYHSISDILYGLNNALAIEYYPTCDMFYYYDRRDPMSLIVFPQPIGMSDLYFASQVGYKNRFIRRSDQDDRPSIMETPGMINKPEIIHYGGGKDTKLTIQFCQELAILLGVVESLNQPVPAIIPGRSVKTMHVNILKNNLT